MLHLLLRLLRIFRNVFEFVFEHFTYVIGKAVLNDRVEAKTLKRKSVALL